MSMSIGPASQTLAALLARLQAAQAAPPASKLAATPAVMPAPDDDEPPPDNGLTGSATPSLSGDVLTTLMQMQNSNSAAAPSADPLQNLFAAMDSDDDGTVSQGEMESYVQNAGGTASQADALFSALDPDGGEGVSESQMASALPSAQAQGVGHHHHHHPHAGGTDQAASDPLAALLDTAENEPAPPNTTAAASMGTPAAQAGLLSPVDTGSLAPLSSADFASLQQTLQSLGLGLTGSLASMFDAFTGATATSATTDVMT